MESMEPMEPMDWNREIKRLDQTLLLIRRQLGQWENVLGDRKTDIVEARKHFGELAFDPLDLEESAMDFRHHSRELDRQELVYSHAFAARRKLLLLLDSPYFGRIDFQERGAASADSIYIGKATVLDEKEEHVLVYDWRAPVASMFYDYQLGDAQYETPEGAMHGNISLKRQYLIQQGHLQHMFDTGLHIADRLLQLLLGQNADDKMKSIVTTIQREQNQIIRETQHRTVIVQGSAGSGKTSAAMQRAAYMLYRHRDTWQAGDILLLSPNGLFGDYVSRVLPELGEENLRQLTFQQMLEEALGPDFAVEDPFSQLESLLASAENDPETEIRSQAIRWKASLSFVEALDAYMRSLETSGMLFKPMGFRNQTVISVDRLERLWYGEFAGMTVRKRVENIKLWMAEELKAKRKASIPIVYNNLLKQPNYLGTEEELLEQARSKVAVRFKKLKTEMEALAFIDYRALYERFHQLEDPTRAAPPVPNLDALRQQTLQGLRADKLPYEDAIPLMYLRQAFVGVEQHHSVRHLMIDEAQDYSPFQLHMIRKIYPRGGMTLLGDFQQAILAHTFASGNSLQELRRQFPAESTRVFELTKSYRSTREIVDLSMSVVRRTDIEPFSRSGERPLVVRVPWRTGLPAAAAEAVRRLQAHGASSIAVVCKTAMEAEEAHGALKQALLGGPSPAQTLVQAAGGAGFSSAGEAGDEGEAGFDELEAMELEPGLSLKVKREARFAPKPSLEDGPSLEPAGTGPATSVAEAGEAKQQEPELELELITKYTQTFKRGIIVIPSYLAKGLEFDGVVVYDASDASYNRERERRLFYTVCTRALHQLTLLTSGALTRFLPDASVYDLTDAEESS